MALKDDTKPDYQLWDEMAFRADIDVQALQPIQRWMYRTLCQAAFVEATRPYLPDDDDKLWKMAGCKSKMQWTENMIPVRSMFEHIVIDDKKLLMRKKLVEDWNDIMEERRRYVERARKGGQARASALSTHKVATSSFKQPQDIFPLAEGKEGKQVKEGKEGKQEASTIPPILPELSEEEMALEQLYKQFVAEWKEIHGESATCPYPTFPEEKLAWKVLHTNHDHELLLKAFRLWAQEQAEQGITERFPLGKFVRVADRYMQKIVPLKTAGVIDRIETEAKQQQMDEARRINDEIRKAREKEKQQEEPGPEAYV